MRWLILLLPLAFVASCDEFGDEAQAGCRYAVYKQYTGTRHHAPVQYYRVATQKTFAEEEVPAEEEESEVPPADVAVNVNGEEVSNTVDEDAPAADQEDAAPVDVEVNVDVEPADTPEEGEEPSPEEPAPPVEVVVDITVVVPEEPTEPAVEGEAIEEELPPVPEPAEPEEPQPAEPEEPQPEPEQDPSPGAGAREREWEEYIASKLRGYNRTNHRLVQGNRSRADIYQAIGRRRIVWEVERASEWQRAIGQVGYLRRLVGTSEGGVILIAGDDEHGPNIRRASLACQEFSIPLMMVNSRGQVLEVDPPNDAEPSPAQ